MTTRRGFLGALIAAPIAAPAVVKELAAPKFASGWRVVGMGGAAKLETLSLSVDTTHLRKALDEIRVDPAVREMLHRRPSWFEEAAPIAPEAWDRLALPSPGVPNRLYGAEINSEGEAI